MPDTIIDGTGKGNRAEVNSSNQLSVRAVQEGEAVFANKGGNAYNINTGVPFISLTDAVDTPILYIKNNEDEDLIIEAIALGIFDSTGGSSTADSYATFIRNPTAGTIITSTPTDVDVNSNRNYGSSNTLTVDAFKGATGDTMTNGDNHIIVLANPGGRVLVTINEVLPKGATFGLKFKPPTSNTAMSIYAAAIVYLDK